MSAKHCKSCGQEIRERPQPQYVRRGDNIPDVSEYSHWNEEAQAVWYAENRYDMEHPDELIENPLYEERDYDGEEDE